ncbi:MAG TPA: aminotransferase class V-fold PLP-dependent enzyme, partial [Fimbriimonadaceae bacterium]|nr:aminotransferase class V-fold PLP-dependent enzyme [Fimbriimonadaceae bacterium]
VEGERQSPYILSACFAGLEGETLVVHLDSKGFAVSAGSACSAGSGATSKVLKALGLPDTLARGAVRFSFGRFNSAEAADRLCKEVEEAVETVRRLYV